MSEDEITATGVMSTRKIVVDNLPLCDDSSDLVHPNVGSEILLWNPLLGSCFTDHTVLLAEKIFILCVPLPLAAASLTLRESPQRGDSRPLLLSTNRRMLAKQEHPSVNIYPVYPVK